MDNEIPAEPPETGAAMDADLRSRLLRERHVLLDLSTRNRLLNLPLRTTNVRTLEIVDEKAAEVFRRLNDGKAMTFLPGVEIDETATEEMIGPQPDDANGTLAARHTDLRLQTKLASEGLQKRLFDIWYDARTLEQEQGVNILYLALGLLRWYDDDKSTTPRYAPLVLLPVALERSTASDKFRLKGRGEPPSPNLTLQARMRADFALTVEDFPDEDEVDLSAYAARVADTVKAHKRWEVLPDAMVLGFFSFAKFLMYRDLDPTTWPTEEGIAENPLIRALLHDGFEPDISIVGEADDIDEILPPAGRKHVVDADSSQTVAIAEAVAGRTLVIKGPPGTGKSQTITNIIAGAVAAGKKVLFVAEKMAALDVVHRRMQHVGLGPLVLELHSNRVSKRAVLEELKRTKDAPPVPPPADLAGLGRLEDLTQTLNLFANRLHDRIDPSGLSPQDILGRLARWRQAGEPGRETPLIGAAAWTAEDAANRRDLAEDMAERLAGLEPIAANPWRGVNADAFDPSETDSLMREALTAHDELLSAVELSKVVTNILGAPQPVIVADLENALAYLQLTPLPRGGDRDAFSDPAWQNPRGLNDLIEAGKQLTKLRDQARTIFNAVGLTADYEAIRAELVTKSGNLFRFLDGPYKRSVASLRSYLLAPLPDASDARLKIVDLALGLKRAEEGFARLAPTGRAFGRLWQDAHSDWDALDNVMRWRLSHTSLPDEVWTKLAAASDTDLITCDGARQLLYVALKAWREKWEALTSRLKLDQLRAFGTQDPTIVGLVERLKSWLGDVEGLSRFIAFAARGRALADKGGEALVEAVHSGKLDGSRFVQAFDGAYAQVLRDVLFAEWPALKAFDGDAQNRLIRQFADQDIAGFELAKAQIAAAHSSGRPKAMGGIGPLGVLNGELAKKRAHLPLRQLLDLAGPAIQDLKPVFMMSPLSVAQFLKPGGLTFDLLIMDEASQIEPVDALGAIARVNQVVVVGDERQLPPTAFFKSLTGEDVAEGEGDATLLQASDTESILDLCLAKGAPHRLLNWHYRSKHQSLIAVSNHEFYDSKLFIVPSPFDVVANMGLKFHHLKETAYDRGGTRTNPEEARIVAEAVIAHARNHFDESLGVAAFSVSQRQAILHELERLRRANPETEPFFSEDRTEPFFVKNLENIQGDERDVIFISVGYGFTADGTLAHNFGPLSAAGGERRLNVLISRAKTRCEVFCNFTGADIDPGRSDARGVAALRLFLTFAQTGRFDAGGEVLSGRSDIAEADIADALRERGYEVKTHIGVSGFRVDIAVVDPKQPGRFILGIECDGAQYREAKTARDRDRLRRQVLEAHGWNIHRVWSADWFLRPKDEMARIIAAIERAGNTQTPAKPPVARPAQDVLANPETEIKPAGEIPALENAVLYEEAAFKIEDIDKRSLSQIVDDVIKVVSIEGPVHADEIATRMRALSGQSRLTPKLKSIVLQALQLAGDRGAVRQAHGFYSLPASRVEVRNRSKVEAAGLRKPDMLPPEEVDAAITSIVRENYGAKMQDLVPAVARQLGFSLTSVALRDAISNRVNALIAQAVLAIRDGLVILAQTD